MKNLLVCLGLFFVLSSVSHRLMGQGQTFKNSVVLGEQCPDFKLTEIHHYPIQSASLKDFSDKWLILDFWTQGCVLCVESFPKLNALQREFKNDIQFLLVGKDDLKPTGGIRSMYDKFRARQSLDLAVAYDTLLFSQFDVKFTPHIVAIDRKGVVRGILGTSTLTRENLELMLSDENVNLPQKRVVYNVQDETANEGLLALNKRFSEFAPWNESEPVQITMRVVGSDSIIGHYKSSGISLKRLYNLAYLGYGTCTIENDLYGRNWRVPILELRDSSAFEEDRASGKGFYSYELFIPGPEATKESMMKAIQMDLQKYFKFTVTFENRLMPYWRLEIYDKDKIVYGTSSAMKSRSGDHSGYELKHISMSDLIWLIWSYHQFQPPFIDETMIDQPIDISLQAIMTDLEDINQALKQNGFQLVKGQRLMSVIVIRDSN